MAFNLKNRHLLSLAHHSTEEIKFLVGLAADLKEAKYCGTEQPLLKRDVKLNVIVRGALHDDLELVRREAHQTQIQSTEEAAHDDEARRDEEEPPGRRHGCLCRGRVDGVLSE